jgi:hypothetical protein
MNKNKNVQHVIMLLQDLDKLRPFLCAIKATLRAHSNFIHHLPIFLLGRTPDLSIHFWHSFSEGLQE